ncbi:MAG: HAD family acid phosphatase [Candidatus Methanomethylicia archaeon]
MKFLVMEAAIFDIDGVIADVSERLRKALEPFGKKSVEALSRDEKKKFWEEFLNPQLLKLDKPKIEVINHVRRLSERGIRIIIVTGRSREKQKDGTIEQLKSWDIPYHEIYFRGKNDLRKEEIYKRSVIKSLLKKGYRIIELWEDNQKVIDSIRDLIPEAKIVKVEG